MSYKDYDAMIAERLGERPTFKLGGEQFTCRRKLHWRKQSKVFLTLANAEGAEITAAAIDFVVACLSSADDRERFLALVAEPESDTYDDDDAVITKGQLDAVVNDLFDYYAGKAEASGDASSDSQPATGEPSNVISLNSKEA